MRQIEMTVDKIVIDPNTGIRYIATSAAQWSTRFAAWCRDRRAWNARLEPLGRRAARRGQWSLYHAAKRAHYARALPCPMPAGHLMFERPDYFLASAE